MQRMLLHARSERKPDQYIPKPASEMAPQAGSRSGHHIMQRASRDRTRRNLIAQPSPKDAHAASDARLRPWRPQLSGSNRIISSAAKARRNLAHGISAYCFPKSDRLKKRGPMAVETYTLTGRA